MFWGNIVMTRYKMLLLINKNRRNDITRGLPGLTTGMVIDSDRKEVTQRGM